MRFAAAPRPLPSFGPAGSQNQTPALGACTGLAVVLGAQLELSGPVWCWNDVPSAAAASIRSYRCPRSLNEAEKGKNGSLGAWWEPGPAPCFVFLGEKTKNRPPLTKPRSPGVSEPISAPRCRSPRGPAPGAPAPQIIPGITLGCPFGVCAAGSGSVCAPPAATHGEGPRLGCQRPGEAFSGLA